MVGKRLDLIAQIEHIRVIEGHVMAIAAENNEVVLEDDACVAVSGGWALTLHVEDLGFSCAAHHGGPLRVAHRPSHGLALAHLLVVLVEVGGIVILDQVGPLHLV